VARLRALVGPAATAAVQGAFLVVVGVGGTRVATGSLTIGDLVAFVLFLFFLVMPLAQAMHAYTQLQTGLGALQRMEEVLDLPDEEATDRPRAGATVSPAAAAVEFHDVTFAYPGGEPVLRNVSFRAPYGTRTALVGPLGVVGEVGGGGVLLSGAGRQRRPTARTLPAAPPILLLDEPTSNLDARNEAALRQAIDTVAVRHTLLIVAHRLSTVVD